MKFVFFQKSFSFRKRRGDLKRDLYQQFSKIKTSEEMIFFLLNSPSIYLKLCGYVLSKTMFIDVSFLSNSNNPSIREDHHIFPFHLEKQGR